MSANNGKESEPEFDPNDAANLLLEIAQERSLETLMDKLVRVGIARPGTARVEVWLIEKPDCRGQSPQKTESPEQTRYLRLAASGSNPPLTATDNRCSHSDSRIALGAGIIGKTAVTGQQTLVMDMEKEPNEFPGLECLKQEKIRSFAVTAIAFKGKILGVLASYSRVRLPEAARVWRQIFADHIGSAVANARAFEEIQRLKAQLEMQNAYLEEEVVVAKAFGDLVGQSEPLRHIVSQIELVAPTDASVLILGETGTGKELVAREIHRRSHRRDNSLIRVNCASIPKDLFESEFFGHTRGAFTGAIKDRVGRFETAEGGTIFLDEIGEVPLDLQGKLLRVLQEKQFERVGEDRTRSADVRIIGATNRDLKKEAAAGRFREDLYYRLNVFPMEVPPLRERIEDIGLLAKHFVELSVKDLRCPKPRLTRAGVTKLQSYNWPGNIRELRNVIERAVIISRGGALDFDLPVADSLPSHPSLKPRGTNGLEPEILTEPEMRRRERENLAAALTKTNWKIRGADGTAELLGLKPTTLVTRMKTMGLKRPG